MTVTRRAALTAFGALASVAPVTAARATTLVSERRGEGGLLSFDAAAPVVDLRALISAPVIIRDVQHLRHSDDSHFLRIISEDGVAGVVKCNSRFLDTLSLFHATLRDGLIGADARDMEGIFERAFRGGEARGYKYAGLAYYTAQGHIDLALWDLLGRTAGKRVAELLGGPRLDRVPVYLTRLTRSTSPEEEVARLAERLETTGAKAVKVKIGGRMSLNADASPGRTDGLIPLLRKTFGDDLVIYVDANGSYDAPTAIEVGRMLEDHGVALYEEPCDWEDFEMTKQVADALEVPVAGGEQDSSLPKWRWFLEHQGLDILQPDLTYNGGILRSLKVARMAAAAGMSVTPHYPRWGAESAPLIHFASVIPNFHGFMEYRSHPSRFDFDYTPVFDATDGAVDLPSGPGFGIDFDPDMLARAEVLAP